MQRRSVHSSWYIAWLFVGGILGVIVARFYGPYPAVWFVLLALVLVVVALRWRDHAGIIMLLVAGVFLGAVRGSAFLERQAPLQDYIGQRVYIAGQVAEDPTVTVDGSLRVRLSNVVVNGEVVGGEVWSSLRASEAIARSDVVLLQGQLGEGFGTIAASLYRAEVIEVRQGAGVDVGRDIRDWFSAGIDRAIDEPQASLGAGFLLGLKTTLPEKLDNELRLLGLTHIIVASGYNLTILVRFARRGMQWLSRFSALAVSGGLVFGFMQLTGYSPSMSRAGLITGLSLVAWYYGRQFHPFVLLSIAAGVTVFINPNYAWGDVGWLLSFGSFVGVILVAPIIHHYFWGEQRAGWFRQILIETFSAQLMAVPIVAMVFGQFSPLALVANVLIVGLIPFAMLFTFIAGLAGALAPPIASVVGIPAEVLMGYMTQVTSVLASRPEASLEIGITATTAIVYYLVLLCGCVYMYRRSSYQLRSHNVVV